MVSEYIEGKEIDQIADLRKSYLMIMYGYINIDGYFDTNDNNYNIEIRYNSLAVDSSKVEIDDLIVYCEYEDMCDKKYGEDEESELSKKIPFFKKRIYSLLGKYNLNENQIEELLQKLGKTKTEFLDEIEEQYKKEQSKKEEQEGPDDR